MPGLEPGIHVVRYPADQGDAPRAPQRSEIFFAFHGFSRVYSQENFPSREARGR